MRYVRPLIGVALLIVALVFVFENQWLWNSHTIEYRFFSWTLLSMQEVPIWALLLSAFALGFLVAWLLGRWDVFALQAELRRTHKQVRRYERDGVAGSEAAQTAEPSKSASQAAPGEGPLA